ncbi:MAG: acyltransferase [Bacteroidales bacterium]|jgi:peptidoglycan/LPS O-acetylase OafA/YrhL|nr:acyltransferase [Bacteroidales bacterium]MDY0086378.1 acyltransferase [Bacteroidales bacterium]
MKETQKRIVYIDFIKVFLTCMVVAHHAGQAYGNTGGVWLVSDNPKLDYLRPFFFLNAAYMMGFYFFISGYFTYFSLNNKPVKKYLKDRFLRLGIPLIFFVFFVFGPLQYFLNQPKTSFLSFLADLYFNQPPLAVGHLWFVASLLAYAIIYLLLVKFVRFNLPFSKKFKPWYPLLYLFFLIPVNVWIRQFYPIDYWVTWFIPIELAHLPQYFSLFLLGALFNKTKWLESINPITAFTYLFLGLMMFIFEGIIYQNFPNLWGESLIESVLCVGLCLGIYTLFKMLFHRMNKFMKLLSDNSYGIYLFHLLIVIALQQLLINMDLNINLKFAIVTIFGIFFSGLLTFGLRKIHLFKRIL